MEETRAGKRNTVWSLGNSFCRVFGLQCHLKNLPRKIHVSLILAGVFEEVKKNLLPFPA